MFAKLLEQQSTDTGRYQIFTEKEMLDINGKPFIIPEVVWEGTIESIDGQLSMLREQIAMYEGYKNQIESVL